MIGAFVFFGVLVVASAQIPSLGFCPDYVPMTDFDIDNFLGKWYESERYFQFSDIVSRCVVTDYARAPSGKIFVSNEVTNRLTGIKRVIDGQLELSGRIGEGKLNVKYSTTPLSSQATLLVLDTDYENYAILWSCSGFGPLSAQSAWVMTRERLPAGPVLQNIYGALDKFKISRTFFVKTDQEGCALAASDINAANGITAQSTIPQATGLPQRVVNSVKTNEQVATNPKEAVKSTGILSEIKVDAENSDIPINGVANLVGASAASIASDDYKSNEADVKEVKDEAGRSEPVKSAVVIFVVTVSQMAWGQVPYFGPCPDVKTVTNFDVKKYAGKWYEVERYFAVFEFGSKCVTADYKIDDNGFINIVNQQISTFTGIQSLIEGNANQISRSEEAKLSINFPSLPITFDAPYWVVGTDYDNYSVVWSCSDFGILSTRNAWILTREKQPTIKIMEKAYKVLDKHGISRAYFIRTDHKNCPKDY
ncbi:unnamed protein product [Phyllotreta striolata]|uniref:Lipocalin/cytosolic fatty-acid binding domain-containing protein n=1 Tax=Phyllotreta striolata TaxID=444603 RepID=A0A9N9TFU6_PHYSR|nr:unnamed protein product [Phyllotreta striolata]